jgi:hypothetical protein
MTRWNDGAELGVAGCIIAYLMSEVDTVDSLLHRCTGLVDRFQAS